MKATSPIAISLGVAAIFIGYFAIGTLRGAGETEEIAANEEEETFAVVARRIAPEAAGDVTILRGRTEAIRNVVVRAETGGRVVATPSPLGARVSEGDVLCELAIDERRSRLDEANAALAKARLDYDAAMKLAKEGYRSETQTAAAKANLDLAEAQMETARLGLERTKVRAPFAGVLDAQLAEAGDLLGAGDGCARLVQLDPVLIVADASQEDVAHLGAGQPARALLTGGEMVQGSVRFVASAAEDRTRTFRVEVEAPNPDHAVRVGLSAKLEVVSGDAVVHEAPRSALVLDDDGRLGVRYVEGDTALFAPVKVIGERNDAVLISGLEGVVDLIIRGQGFVSEGQTVRVVPEEARHAAQVQTQNAGSTEE